MASHYNCNYNRKCNYNYYYITYYATQITPHYNYNYTTLHYTTPAYIHYTIPHYSTQHYSTLHYTTLITPHHNYNCNCTNYIIYITSTIPTALQLQLQLHYTTLHPAVVVRWPQQPLQPLQKTQLQPPFGGFALPSVIHNSQPLL